MKRLIKFLHTVSSLGLIGGLAAYMLILWTWPEVTDLEGYAALRGSLAAVSGWLLLPSMMLVLITGLLAMALHHPFHDAPWVWIKALTGILVFEATLASVDGPAQAAAKLSVKALAGEIDAATLAGQVRDEWGAWWALLGLALVNVALATWRPRFNGSRKRRRERARARASTQASNQASNQASALAGDGPGQEGAGDASKEPAKDRASAAAGADG